MSIIFLSFQIRWTFFSSCQIWGNFFSECKIFKTFLYHKIHAALFLFLELNVFNRIVLTHVWIIVQNFLLKFESIVMHVHVLYRFWIKHMFVVRSWIKTDVPDVSVTLFTHRHLFLSTICISVHASRQWMCL